MSTTTIDQPLVMKIEGLTPFQEIELVAEARDQKDELWTSTTKVIANESGVIADEADLFWSMLPASGDTTANFKCKNDLFSADISLKVDGVVIEKRKIDCYLKLPEVHRIALREEGLVGTLFIPPSEKPLPIIIALSGSNGGISENRAKLLASSGFAVLALGYFGVDGLPSNLENIPLEYFETAFRRLKKQPNLDASRLGIYGVSRGAELSLILGSIFPSSIQAIVAVVPSSVVYGGLNEAPVHAWLYQGKPIAPFAPVPQTDFSKEKGQNPDNPAKIRSSFLEGMKDRQAFAAAAIAVENIQCPILLISAGDDQMWPSEMYANQIMERLKANNSSIIAKHLNYPDAGHGINIPNLPVPEPVYYHPISKLWFSMGGSREADAKASKDSWAQLVAFFKESLNGNLEKFSELKSFNLDPSQYAIIGSGPLGIRNLKIIGDIDIIVTPELWGELAAKYGVIDRDEVRKIVFPGADIEAFREGSFYSEPFDDQAPSIASRIKNAEMIDGLPFDALKNTLYYKRKAKRDKDLKDILLIEEWLAKESAYKS